jgi:hypothetical protein
MPSLYNSISKFASRLILLLRRNFELKWKQIQCSFALPLLTWTFTQTVDSIFSLRLAALLRKHQTSNASLRSGYLEYDKPKILDVRLFLCHKLFTQPDAVRTKWFGIGVSRRSDLGMGLTFIQSMIETHRSLHMRYLRRLQLQSMMKSVA